jgi:hypothetical protein
MTKSLDSDGQLSASDAKVLSDIKRVGWHTLGVSPRQSEEGPHWAFSIGLYYSFNHPEVIVLGLPLNTCTEIVNVIGKQIEAGVRFEADTEYTDILQDPFRCTFRAFERAAYRVFVGYSLWFYENDEFPLLQCFWPDKQLHFPWDDGCNEFVKNLQLYRP